LRGQAMDTDPETVMLRRVKLRDIFRLLMMDQLGLYMPKTTCANIINTIRSATPPDPKGRFLP